MVNRLRRPLGVNTWVWTSPLDDAALERLAAHVAGLGFDVIELPLENAGDWDPARAADVLDRLGLTPVVVGAMGAGRSLLEGAGDVEGTMDYLHACIAAAARIGARTVAGPFYAPTGRTWRMSTQDRADAGRQLRERWRRLSDGAQAHGIAIGIEPLNRYETSVMNTVEQGLELLGDATGTGLGLALDTYHLGIEEKRPVDAIRRAGASVVHVQVCGSDRGAVGDDHTPWPDVIAALDDIGYAGPLVVESFTADNAIIAVAASIWRPLAASPDELATRSLACLRALQGE